MNAFLRPSNSGQGLGLWYREPAPNDFALVEHVLERSVLLDAAGSIVGIDTIARGRRDAQRPELFSLLAGAMRNHRCHDDPRRQVCHPSLRKAGDSDRLPRPANMTKGGIFFTHNL